MSQSQGVETIRRATRWCRCHSRELCHLPPPPPYCLLRHGSKLYFSIPPQTIPLSAMFASIESVKDRLGILEYSLSQTSLEQVRY